MIPNECSFTWWRFCIVKFPKKYVYSEWLNMNIVSTFHRMKMESNNCTEVIKKWWVQCNYCKGLSSNYEEYQIYNCSCSTFRSSLQRSPKNGTAAMTLEIEVKVQSAWSIMIFIVESTPDYPQFWSSATLAIRHQNHRNGFPLFSSSRFTASFDYPPPSIIRQHLSSPVGDG